MNFLKKISNKRVLVAGLLLGIVLIGLLFPVLSHAANEPYEAFLDDCGITDVVCGIQNIVIGLLWVIGSLFGILTVFFASLTSWLIHFGTVIIGLPVVRSGFAVTLSVANLVFVMALIVSAFQVILGINERNAKKMISLVILAAILVNFSFLIAGFLLDISNVFTEFFAGSVTAKKFAESFGKNNLDKVLIPSPNGLNVEEWSTFFLIFQVSILRIILYMITAIALLATAIMTLVRNIWVAFLLLLMPLSWAMWGFPMLQKYHKEWWDNFLKWGLIYLPSMTFFLWLALETAKNIETFSKAQGAIFPVSGGGFEAVLAQAAINIIQILILVGLMIGGLKIAQKLGGAGSNIGMGLAGRAGKLGKRMGIGAAKGVGKGLYVGSGARRAGKASARKLSTVLSTGKYNPLQYVGGRALGAKLNKAGQYTKQIDAYQKSNYEGLSDDQLMNTAATTGVAKAAKLKELQKRKKLGEYNKNNKGGMERLATGALPHLGADDDSIKSVLALDPTLAPKLLGAERKEILGAPILKDGKPTGFQSAHMESQDEANARIIEEQVIKNARADKIAEWGPSTLEHPAVISALTKSKAAMRAVLNGPAQIAEKFTKELDKTMQATLGGDHALLGNLDKSQQQANDSLKEAVERGNVQEIEAWQIRRKEIKTRREAILAKPNVKRLTDAKDFAEQTIAGKFNQLN